ncbi:YceI family protein [Litoribacter ruber]|uniref:YceI family protein n=1 Tax=Litoribacter ruber TaxID=702568 RepID=A0AAP2CH92_9BACT|nr:MULTISPECIES: YceI family protein [Litoribacter]MBS9524671.1 YceI family protein [Litoribacter alkaliphilus]MBT0812691.1 YceI family protein [Litoribacter ruber]
MRVLKMTGLALATGLMLASCDQGNTVETRDAQEVANGEGMAYTVDTQASQVTWTGYKPAGKHYGTIAIKDGELNVDGNNITGGRFVMDLTALEIEDLRGDEENYQKLYGHLQSPDFFDTENHPEAVFEVTGVEPFTSSDDIQDEEEYETDNTPKSSSEQAIDNPTHWISGNLTMRGNTKNIKFPARVNINDGSVTAKAGFNIDRTQWKVAYGDESSVTDKAKDSFIYNTVNVGFELNAN